MAASSTTVLPADSSTRQAWRFGLLCAAFIALWFVSAAYGLGDSSGLDTALCNQLATASAWGLRALGWAAATDATQPSLLLLNGQPSVIVGTPCDGLVLYALLAGFVVAYPGPARRRLWFIPLGIAALWLLNVVRIIVLALNYRYSPETFEFDHHYAFNAVAYAALGGLWLLWTRQGNSAAIMPAEPASLAASPTRQLWFSTRLLAGLAVLALLIATSIYQNQLTAALSTCWVAVLTSGPAWLHRLPGAAAGTGKVPDNITQLPLPVGAAYLGLFVGLALLVLRLLLPAQSWRLAWRCYAALGVAATLLLVAGRLGGIAEAGRLSRPLFMLLASLLPVVGLLVLLWRGPAATSAPALPAGEPAR
jgi:exosortase/archaeosortase family protein